MKNMRRIKRMSRGAKRKKIPGMNLVSLMDVFTILVFFLLVNSANTEELDNPKNLKLPDSVAERKPDQTIVVMITPDNIMVRGEVVTTVEEAIEQEQGEIESLRAVLQAESKRMLNLSTESSERGKEITIMGDRQLPFRLLKKVMSTCTAAGFSEISLAVMQKASQTG